MGLKNDLENKADTHAGNDIWQVISDSEKNLPFAIEASAGYVIARDHSKGIDEYINDADDMMYQEKKKRKAERLS